MAMEPAEIRRWIEDQRAAAARAGASTDSALHDSPVAEEQPRVDRARDDLRPPRPHERPARARDREAVRADGRVQNCEEDFGEVRADAHLTFLKNGFQEVDLTWPQRNWSFVQETFHQRFGAPNETGVEMLQNAMGATVASHWERWNWPHRTLSIVEYGSQIDECAGTLKTDAYERAVAAKREREAQDAAAKF